MIRISFAGAGLFLAAAFSVSSVSVSYAQPAAPSLSEIEATRRKWDRLEGTVMAGRAGLQTRAKLRFQAPDLLQMEIDGDEARLLRPQKVVASGDETLLFDGVSKRLQLLPFNVTKQWWRGWDSPTAGLPT